MKKIASKNKVQKNEAFYYLESHRNRICLETKNSLRFFNKDPETNIAYYCWIPKSIVFKKEYSLLLNVHIPRSWKSLSVENSKGEIFDCDDIKEFARIMNFKYDTF